MVVMPTPKIPLVTKKRGCEMLLAGKSITTVGNVLNISRPIVVGWAAELGMTREDHDEVTKRLVNSNGETYKVQAEATKLLRAKISEKFLLEADRQLEKLHQPFTMVNIGGSRNTVTEHQVPEPPPGEAKQIMWMAAVAYDKHLKQQQFDNVGESTGAASMLSKLGEAFDQVAQAMSGTQDSDDTSPDTSSTG